MSKPKLHICYNFKATPWGGGNQFLRALKKEFIKLNIYEENIDDSDIVLFNSHHNLNEVINFKLKYPEKVLIHRIDGPVRYIRGNDYQTDKIIFLINKKICDGTIFQSKYSYKQSKNLGFKKTSKIKIIYNSANNEIFNNKERINFSLDRKIKIVISSWSSNWNKGFHYYEFLDKNLDFNKYELIFIGNSPIEFKNIINLGPKPIERIAKLLKKSDIYITGSKNDPCSNAVIEALHCGLPVIALQSGGHAELIKDGGLTFKNNEDLLKKIEEISIKYDFYQKKIVYKTINEISKIYYDFMKKIYDNIQRRIYYPKRITKYESFIVKLQIRLLEKLRFLRVDIKVI